MSGLQPQHVQQIHELIEADQILLAIQVYRAATGVSLAEAKRAVEEMAQNERAKPPAGAPSYDDPVLESKIQSLLSKGKKIEAVKIYRARYNIGLKEAKDAVDRIEAMMPRDVGQNLPYESAIGGDPFADDSDRIRRILIILAVLGALIACAFLFYTLLGDF